MTSLETPSPALQTQAGENSPTTPVRAAKSAAGRVDRSLQMEYDKWMKIGEKVAKKNNLTLLKETKEATNVSVINNLRELRKELDATDWMYDR